MTKLNLLMLQGYNKKPDLPSFQIITKDYFMASTDLKDAYYSVKISKNFTRYLKFEFLDKLDKFVCFPNGLAPCPRKFTKIAKVPLSDLRLPKIVVSGYIYDFFTKDHTRT